MNIPILLYHSVSEEVAPPFQRWTVQPERFSEQLSYLQTQGYTPLTVAQLAAATTGQRTLPERPVVVTFDDGLADFYTEALPLLKKHDFVATLFLTTDYIGKTSRWLAAVGEGERPMLNWEQVRELERYGVECGAHTRTHPQLDTLSTAQAWGEIVGSKRTLEANLGKPVVSFAYPHGYYSAATKKLTKQAGFSAACAVKQAMSNPTDDPFALARIIIEADTDLTTFKNLLDGRGVRPAPSGERWQTQGWRVARRLKKLLKTRPQRLEEAL